MQLAASRTFWTADSRRPRRMAMIPITTSSSISVKPGLWDRGAHIAETPVGKEGTPSRASLAAGTGRPCAGASIGCHPKHQDPGGGGPVDQATLNGGGAAARVLRDEAGHSEPPRR